MAQQLTPRSAPPRAVERLPAAQPVQVLGVLIGIQGTITLTTAAPAGCVAHCRLLPAGVCAACQALAGALGGGRW